MSRGSPELGSLAVQAPSLTPQVVHVSPSTCHNLSVFKELMKEYRRLDDSITMRLNRTNAQFRDKDRLAPSSSGGKMSQTVQDQACLYVWKELVENWRRRTEIIDYCVGVVDQSMEQKRTVIQEKEDDPAGQRKIQGALFAEEVKRNQVHNELAVEKIVRRRSLDAFTSRCRYFSPPPTEVEARKWWEAAQERS
ncbi:uncharacterized protein STEHIDRAFT_140204 [Stereum hirsutum FP-91666 SS1]|uniref:uncharacterized protein n=1 Tax=Stereum hirsutum (strain FP-91666) TaxID=721885 RepID=UPI0004449B2E|nr:uncharacterized protein STEHIDRAFT_140204 [Stereum hirsutum FP-91666 SS1]EIM85633.1 hypothetical protein STEHIDRAFT_140204 [Stereum hirsutum FP-91666 SS1]